jgi:hypothetical protein
VSRKTQPSVARNPHGRVIGGTSWNWPSSTGVFLFFNQFSMLIHPFLHLHIIFPPYLASLQCHRRESNVSFMLASSTRASEPSPSISLFFTTQGADEDGKRLISAIAHMKNCLALIE